MEQGRIERLFEEFGDDVYRLALSMLGNRQDAEDVTQGVFVKLLEGRMRYGEGQEKKWLLTCAANACRNLLNSKAYKNEELDPSFEARERENTGVLDAVLALPAEYRAAVHLYYFEGYSQGEIAKILHISRTAVQTRIFRAREKLRKELGDEL